MSTEGLASWGEGVAFVAELDPALQERIEALTYVNVQAACRMLGAEGVAGELLDAMTAHLYG